MEDIWLTDISMCIFVCDFKCVRVFVRMCLCVCMQASSSEVRQVEEWDERKGWKRKVLAGGHLIPPQPPLPRPACVEPSPESAIVWRGRSRDSTKERGPGVQSTGKGWSKGSASTF